VILVSYRVPGTNGVQLVRFVRSLDHRRMTAVVMVTGSGEVTEEALAAGADEVLLKPINANALVPDCGQARLVVPSSCNLCREGCMSQPRIVDDRVWCPLCDDQYEVGTKKQEWLSRAIDENEVWSLDELRSHPQFVRTEQLLGLQVYVFRNEISAQDWSEMWFVPETGRIPLKIHTSYDGGKEQHVVEPISLSFGEIPDSVFDGPTLPVSFERVQELIKAADEQAGHEYAEAIRRSVAEAQSKKH
jgi:CheY-like chemotaxis protein